MSHTSPLFADNPSFSGRFNRLFMEGIAAYRNGAADGSISDPRWQDGFDYGKAASQLVSQTESAATVREWDDGRQQLAKEFPRYPSRLLTKFRPR